MKLLAVFCTAIAVVAAVDGSEMRGVNLAVAAPSGSNQGPQHAANPPVADKDKQAHVDAKQHEQHEQHDQHDQHEHEQSPKNDAKDKNPAPSATTNPSPRNDQSNKRPSSDADDTNREEKPQHHPTKSQKIDDNDDDDSDVEEKYMQRVNADKNSGKQPGRMKMLVPPRTVHTPQFELDTVIELQWEYDANVIEVPEKLMISVQLPRDPHDPGAKPVIYDIAVNVTGDRTKFFWDTKNDVPEGVGMREGSGYVMYFYDAEIGFRMSDVVPAGYLIKYAMPFAFYISRYERTNDGVPRNYNPNGGARLVPRMSILATIVAMVAFAIHAWV
ncbi:hypothetical protein GGH17_004776 [Coemansia sp. RSA 788]|nr:hypothetical protein GGH17_004776 [Coemansia sp. RSA 788]